MTAEIAVMNKGAVALAADSAVTVQRRGESKIYNSMNKLFMLSKQHPVGVMVYGAADFLGVPWETVIKEYRERAGKRDFDTVRGHMDCFLRFLPSEAGLFSEEEQEHHFAAQIGGWFQTILDEIDNRVGKRIASDGEIDEATVQQIASETIDKAWTGLDRRPSLTCFGTRSLAEETSKHRSKVEEIQASVFKDLPMLESSRAKLGTMALAAILKDIFPEPHSGVVVAGFGSKEHYPALVSALLDGFYDGALRFKIETEMSITDNQTSAIVPFAQAEMVHTFMQGIAPDWVRYFEGYVKELFTKLPSEIGKALGQPEGGETESLAKKLNEFSGRAFQKLRDETGQLRAVAYVDPVLNAVAFLPKDELAAMAETLVSLTSFKRRVSMGEETVGGPIDVGVISKGDGFIWIKRKHYFKAEYNPGFIARYYRADDSDTSG
ncbi:MAG: hypothetical protein MUP47_05420 [Phycisphaerae bacterium]|nr:hypothetical protein [Phycisphaerae bacterium]